MTVSAPSAVNVNADQHPSTLLSFFAHDDGSTFGLYSYHSLSRLNFVTSIPPQANYLKVLISVIDVTPTCPILIKGPSGCGFFWLQTPCRSHWSLRNLTNV